MEYTRAARYHLDALQQNFLFPVCYRIISRLKISSALLYFIDSTSTYGIDGVEYFGVEKKVFTISGHKI
ncbi:16100_t:CDS:2 [Dentiscutata heterogama]|uniref:16100_t:CDS:1 n=1 Tax=Dentiscutata heterogama TaxID=1316150 RepID=A0ACA9L369_9GLOM|nr:16100_t:CDS:2 [Dentiscutata heterogama]